MQAILNKCQSNLNFLNDVEMLVDDLKSADNVLKNEIENKIVSLCKMGADVVDFLVKMLPSLKGAQRGVVAMSIIRAGELAVEPLMIIANEKNENQWIANYLLSEINA